LSHFLNEILKPGDKAKIAFKFDGPDKYCTLVGGRVGILLVLIKISDDDISLSLLLLISPGIFITRDFRQKYILPYHDITTRKT
jgi:hypothetical protein